MTAGQSQPAAPTVVWLDWSKHKVGIRQGKCRLCGKPAWMRDELGKPCHKTCAEKALAEKTAQATANYQQMRTVQ